jgi:uncharacterized protein
MKIFFATDIHGSTVCFKKLLNAKKFYNVDVVILGGDMTGKLVIPILKLNDSLYTSDVLQQKFTLRSDTELITYQKNLENMGLYPYLTDEAEMKQLENDKKTADSIFRKLITERLRLWVELADKKYKEDGTILYVCPGNDDDYYIDDILRKSVSIINLENTVYSIGDYQILSTGHSNMTPWNTPREISEDQLETILRELRLKLNKTKTTIFNIHVPPFNSKIDECADLDSEFRVVTSLGQIKKKPVGSIAVRKLVEEVQPALGLFGHVHEGKGWHKVGSTLCINPGSNYQEGVLNGCIVNLEKSIVTGYQFVTG